MRNRTARLRTTIAFALLASACAADVGGRYRVSTDPASRHSFKYVQDRASGLWVHRECEVRVSVQRKLPDPITDNEHGDMLHSSRFEPGAVGTGNLSPSRFVVENGYRIWRFQEVLTEADYAGKTSFGVEVDWPVEGQPTRNEPLELFALPPPGNTPANQWSSWRTADRSRTDPFGWWEEVHEAPPEEKAAIPYPFELRFRLLLKDHLYVD